MRRDQILDDLLTRALERSLAEAQAAGLSVDLEEVGPGSAGRASCVVSQARSKNPRVEEGARRRRSGHRSPDEQFANVVLDYLRRRAAATRMRATTDRSAAALVHGVRAGRGR
ncbi:MAG: hypothetical protein IPP07_21420 [Holophagales bacterium]|nr:hypothetical protein [Holophagales bacterium]